MHPAFSVVFFTTASGAGYGLWFWLGLLALTGALPGRDAALLALVLGFIGVSAGLLSSTLHLGKPQRAWRAFSQWRSSWLSREGIVAVASFAPMLWLGWLLWTGAAFSAAANDGGAALANGSGGAGLALQARLAGGLLLLLSLATVACTAMIYASLKPVPAWRHPLVVPVYLLFSVFTGGLVLAAVLALSGMFVGNLVGLGAALLAFALWRLKRVGWRAIDTGVMPVTRNAALGLPEGRAIGVFERPHTEANYLLREMGFVLARKHSRKLRLAAVVLFALIPLLCALPVWLLPHFDGGPLLLLAAFSALLGTFVERWLFFAEARHLVTLYY